MHSAFLEPHSHSMEVQYPPTCISEATSSAVCFGVLVNTGEGCASFRVQWFSKTVHDSPLEHSPRADLISTTLGFVGDFCETLRLTG